MTTTTYTRKTREERDATDATVAAAMAQVTEAVTQIKSSEEWKAYLRFGARFHKYSFNNMILLWLQGMDREMAPITPIATFALVEIKADPAAVLARLNKVDQEEEVDA